MSIIKTLKHNKKIICYITEHNNNFKVCTGKPSDASCLSWSYDNITDADATAVEYCNNYTSIKAV